MSQDRDSHDRDRDRDRVWEIVEKVGVCMLATQFEGGLRARPLEARPERDAGLIWFVTDIRSGKEQEIEAEHDVCLVFIRRQGRGLPFHHRPRRGAA
jgi:general stress protein 26